MITNKIALDFDFNTILLQSGEETVYQAVERAIQLWQYLSNNKTQESVFAKTFKSINQDFILCTPILTNYIAKRNEEKKRNEMNNNSKVVEKK